MIYNYNSWYIESVATPTSASPSPSQCQLSPPRRQPCRSPRHEKCGKIGGMGSMWWFLTIKHDEPCGFYMVLYMVLYGFIWVLYGCIWTIKNCEKKMVFNQQTWWTNADLTTQKGWKKQWLNHPQTMISIINGGLRVHFLGPPIVPLLKTRPVLLDRWCSIFGPHPHKVWEGQEWSVRMFALRILFHIQLLYAIIVIRVKKTRAYIILYIMYIDLV